MRAAVGLGLIAICCTFACTTVIRRESFEPETDVDDNDPDPNAPPAPLVPNITLTDVAVFQAVKVPVVEGGELVARKTPIVANRTGLVRAYVAPGSGWSPREVTGELRLVAGKKKFPIIRETKTISGASREDDPESTFNFEVPGDSLPPGVTFHVALTAKDGDEPPEGEHEGRFPRDGSFEDLEVAASGKLRVVLVPVKYTYGGNSLTPKLDDEQIALYHHTLASRYPATEVEITKHATFTWSMSIGRTESADWSRILTAITDLRQRDQVDDDVYYYGLLTPGSTFASFCQGTCIAGLSTVAEDAEAATLRASVGVGWPGSDAANTMAHEIGHAHGREHAPCGGPQGVDRDFPYEKGAIGVWGYDIFDRQFIAPKVGRDMMGYCPNEWISDYTFSALFERIKTVNAPAHVARAGTPSHYRIGTVDGRGTIEWNGDTTLKRELTGGIVREASFIAESGTTVAKRNAHYFRFDHAPGGFVYVPDEGVRLPWTRINVAP
jgi:hypothetical protein